MTDTNRESLSALIDGEASEIETLRLVREFADDASLRKSWAAYQQIRVAARGISEGRGLSPAEHEALHQRISAAVDAEAAHDVSVAAKPGAGLRKAPLAGGLALAASLLVAVMVWLAYGEQGAEPALQAQATQALEELDEDKQRRLRTYLDQHEQMWRSSQRSLPVGYQNSRGTINQNGRGAQNSRDNIYQNSRGAQNSRKLN
ncbi:MAG: sigma-E factor negative regulatory protein [Pseudomonadales bacterium]